MTQEQFKEVAKFFAGVTAWEAVVHAALGLGDALPITLLGFTLTPAINTVQIVVPAAVSLALAYYAWFRK